MRLSVGVFFGWVAVTLLLSGCSASSARPNLSKEGRVLVIGMDGMDPKLLTQFMGEGKLPHFQQLTAEGSFSPLATSMPPQSPVAWSNVISGAQPGTHQIYDFIHRDPQTYLPYFSTSTTEAPAQSREISLGRWRIPLTSEVTKLHRQGPTFWEDLVAHGVDTTVYRMPANYPAKEVSGAGEFECLTGMGTPDLVGSYGEFTLFGPDVPLQGRRVPGGRFVFLPTVDHRAKGALEGPENFLLRPEEKKRTPRLKMPFVAVRDPDRDLVKITLGNDVVLLKQGEWSPWIQFDYETEIPGSAVLKFLQAPTSLPGMVRFYVKQVYPEIVLFATPVNIDPTRPVNPVSVPADFSRQLADATGLFFTAGIPEHTPEVQQRGLNEDEWLHKSDLILRQRIRQFRYALANFKSGCLFYYFGSPDLISHIFWRDQDPDHPGRDPEQKDRYRRVIEETYIAMDSVVGDALAALREGDTLIVISDHGFASFRWGFNLNSWLLENGYITLRDPKRRQKAKVFTEADWDRTAAYGLGLNALYVNLVGRESQGIIPPGAEHEILLEELSEKLLQVCDKDGTPVISKIYNVTQMYPHADPQVAPDLLIGYSRNYRASWETVLGGMPEELIVPNENRWSGDHCIAADLVPGILVTNRKISVEDPSLSDIGPTILELFGIAKSKGMIGRPLFELDNPVKATPNKKVSGG